jgi:hypothetical protein
MEGPGPRVYKGSLQKGSGLGEERDYNNNNTPNHNKQQHKADSRISLDTS